MSPTVATLWRHPIKSHGREALERVALSVGQCVPWDRHWAVPHERSKFDGEHWASCQNFMLGTRTPGLAGIWAKLNEATGQVTLRHKDLGEITFDPEAEADAFLKWVDPLYPANRARGTGIVRADRGMTDTDFPSVSIMTNASHAAVEAQLGHPLEQERWRGNIWLDGVAAWEEFDWIGKTVRIGTAEIRVVDRIERCMHTTANPITGERDVDTLRALTVGFGHTDFGVYGEVIKAGDVVLGDAAEVL